MVVAIVVLPPPNKPPRPPLKLPFVIWNQEHCTHDCPHKYEIYAMLKSQTKNTSIEKPISPNVVVNVVIMITTWSKFVPKQQSFKDQKPKKAKNVVD
jgi:hypothetical protein